MGLDYSRIRFDARKDFLGVLMQQGRVQLDSDWNDWVAELARRIQAGALDTVGPAVVPRATPDGFEIGAEGGALTIGAGRMYVDGLLAENHGEPPADEWDPRLAELSSSRPVGYTAQPYLPNPAALPSTPGPHLVYLDVWQREVGPLQDPGLVESAVGVDTTGRLQTVWQVKVLPDVGSAGCSTDDAEVPGWPETILPSGARLSTSKGTVTEAPNPCQVPPGAGYTGLENQLYRIEIHTPGPAGTATFKWSRDNATVATRVTHINAAGDQLTVESTGKDDVLRFNDGDWVEITDDWRELHNLPGELRRIALSGGVDDVSRTIGLESPVTSTTFPVDAQSTTDPDRHTVIRRWDQGGQVRLEDGTNYIDLSAAGSTGDIPVPPAGTRVFLENGILAEFTLDPTGGEFRSGDYWVVAARAVDATFDELDRAAPLGVHHHYARLAVVTFPDHVHDCRILWPPQGGCGDCTVCVTPEGHNSGAATIQHAVDAVQAVGGTICLAAGTYAIDQPIRIDKARSLRLRGQGWATILLARSAGTVIDVAGGSGIALENLSVIGGGGAVDQAVAGTGLVMVAATDVVDFRMQHCNVLGIPGRGTATVALGLSGAMLGAAVTDCTFVATDGVVSGPGRRKYLLAAHLRIADNVVFCRQRGIAIERISFYAGDCTLAANLILGCADTALVATGGTLAGSYLTISDNAIHTWGAGIRAGADDLSIRQNHITGQGEKSSDGIVLRAGLDPVAMDRLQIIGNRLLSLGGRGIVVGHRIETGAVKQNTVDGAGGPGLTVEPGGSLGHVSIENNRFANLGSAERSNAPLAGLQIVSADSVDLVGNVVEGVGRAAASNRFVAGVAAAAVGELRAAGNRVHNIGPDSGKGLTAGIYVAPPVPQIAVDDNSVYRTGEGGRAATAWIALLVFPVSGGGDQAANAWFSPNVLNIGSYKFAHAQATTYVISPTHLAVVSRVPSEVSVRGNRLHSRNVRVPLVVVGGGLGMCLFSENHCRVEGPVRIEPVHGFLASGVNNVTNNRLSAQSERASLHLVSNHTVVLGNVSSGPITVNGAGLPAPFDQLNLLVP